MAAKKKVSKSKKVSKPKVEKLGILTGRTEFTELKEQFNDFKGWATHEIVKLQKRVGELEDGVATLEETLYDDAPPEEPKEETEPMESPTDKP